MHAMFLGLFCGETRSIGAPFERRVVGFSYFLAALVAPFLPSTLLADLSGGKRPSAGSNAGVARNLVRGKGETRACLTPPRIVGLSM